MKPLIQSITLLALTGCAQAVDIAPEAAGSEPARVGYVLTAEPEYLEPSRQALELWAGVGVRDVARIELPRPGEAAHIGAMGDDECSKALAASNKSAMTCVDNAMRFAYVSPSLIAHEIGHTIQKLRGKLDPGCVITVESAHLHDFGHLMSYELVAGTQPDDLDAAIMDACL